MTDFEITQMLRDIAAELGVEVYDRLFGYCPDSGELARCAEAAKRHIAHTSGGRNFGDT